MDLEKTKEVIIKSGRLYTSLIGIHHRSYRGSADLLGTVLGEAIRCDECGHSDTTTKKSPGKAVSYVLLMDSLFYY